MQILFVDENHPVLHERLMKAGHRCDLLWGLSVAELLKLLPEYNALVIRSRFVLTEEILSTCKKLKVIGRVGAGMENIDVAFAKKAGIVCLNVPEGNRDAVGEHALGMLLMLLNHLKRADAEVRKGIWRRAENRGRELGGMAVGIIGYGNTGRSFARKLSGIGCSVLAYDKCMHNFSDAFATESTMAELFEHCDIVSLHIPLNAETKYLANKKFFDSFRKQIYFVNTARGPCTNTADLVEALRTEKVIGACLDVIEYEESSFEKVSAEVPGPLQYLRNAEQVIMTPHIAGWTHDSNYKMSSMLAEKMLAVLKVN